MKNRCLMMVAVVLIAAMMLTGCAKTYPYELSDIGEYADVLAGADADSVTGFALEHEEVALVISQDDSRYRVVILDENGEIVVEDECKANDALAALAESDAGVDVDKARSSWKSQNK